MKWYEQPEIQWPKRDRGGPPAPLADVIHEIPDFKNPPVAELMQALAERRHEYMQRTSDGMWHCICGCGLTLPDSQFHPTKERQ